MNRNDELRLILGFGLSWPDDDRGRRTNISELWKEAKRQCLTVREMNCWMLFTLFHGSRPPDQVRLSRRGFSPNQFRTCAEHERLDRLLSCWRLQRRGVARAKSPLSRTLRAVEEGRRSTMGDRGAHSWRRLAGFRSASRRIIGSFVWDFGLFRAEFCAKQTQSPTPNARYQANAHLGRLYRFRHIDYWSSAL